MTQRPLVSVYVPTKNRLDLLRRALHSLACQTYGPLEVLVVDDGSTDGTPGLLAELCRQKSNWICIRNEVSLGAPAARNKAISAARGEFITGLDDDDEFLPDRIERFVEDWQARERRGEVFSALYAQDVSRTGHGQAITRKPAQVNWQDLCRLNLINNQVFTRRSTLQTIGTFDPVLPMWQDLECWMRLTAAFGPARLTDAPTYVFYTDAATDRLSHKGKTRLQQAYEHVVSKHLASLRLADQRSLFLQMYADHYRTETGWEDIRTFVRRFGLYAPGVLRLARLALRQRLSKLARAVKRGGR